MSAPVPVPQEEWRPVPSTGGAYFASNLGRIRGPKRILRPSPTGFIRATGENPYLKVYAAGRQRTVHALVAEAWIGPRPAKLVIDHINRDPKDNRPENLRYVTASVNARNCDGRACSLCGANGHNCRTCGGLSTAERRRAQRERHAQQTERMRSLCAAVAEMRAGGQSCRVIAAAIGAHRAAVARVASASPPKGKRPYFCSACNGPGHQARTCDQRTHGAEAST